jgi:hypothetical protein
MNNTGAMATRTLAETPTLAGTASLPPRSGTANKPVAAVQRLRYVLADSGGRYRLWTDSYAEYGRLDFLDLPAAGYISRVHFALKLEGGELYIRDRQQKRHESQRSRHQGQGLGPPEARRRGRGGRGHKSHPHRGR